MHIQIRFRILLGFALLLSACGGGKGGSGGGAIAQIEVTPQQANLSPGQTIQFSATARNASGNTIGDVTFSWQSLDPNIATIDSNGLATGRGVGVATIVAASGTFTGNADLGVVNAARGASNLTLSGTAQYEDKPFDQNGFTGARTPTPIRGAVVNLIAIDGFATLATGATGQDGTFSFSGLDNSARRGGIYLQVLSMTDPSSATKIEIRNNPDERALFGVSSASMDDGAGSAFTGVQILASAASRIGGAFNSLDVFSKASELIQSAGPCNRPNHPPTASPCVPPLLTAYWEPGGSTGTFYDNQQNVIYILGGGTSDKDTDEYDDSVIAHEYGHFAVAQFSHDNSPGGSHVITDNAQDIRLSFSEGWGNFFSSAARNNPLYVDTFGQSVFSFELEGLTSPQLLAPPTLPTLAVYDTHELSNAKVLWDIFDAPANDDDPLQLGFTPVWQTILQLPPLSPATMEFFWLTFKGLDPGDAPGLQSILQARKIEFTADPAPSALMPDGAAQHHTLYKSDTDPTADEDVIPLNGLTLNQHYTVETLNLTNAADTFLVITDASENPISGLQNDNRNGADDQSCDTATPVGDNGQSGSACRHP